eukprot:2971327-Prymnesium_polylepis.1
MFGSSIPSKCMNEKVQRPRTHLHQCRRIPSGLGIVIVGFLPERGPRAGGLRVIDESIVGQ